MTIEEIGILVAIATTLATASRFVYIKFREQQKKYRNLLQGQWINYGSIGGEPETHYLQLDLKVDAEDGEITGIIECNDPSDESDPWRLSINGQIRFRSAAISFRKVSQGRVSILGKARISFINNKNLSWRILEDVNNFFPRKTTIWKSRAHHEA